MNRGERRRSERGESRSRQDRMWWLLGIGGFAVVAAVVVIVVVAVSGGESEADEAALVPAGAHVVGDPNAPVALVVFSNFT